METEPWECTYLFFSRVTAPNLQTTLVVHTCHQRELLAVLFEHLCNYPVDYFRHQRVTLDQNMEYELTCWSPEMEKNNTKVLML